MAKQKQKSQAKSSEKELAAAVKKLKAQLADAERSAERWKARAKDQRSKATGRKAELALARRRLEKAEANAAKWKGRAAARVVMPAAPPPEPAGAPVAGPDDTWTVPALRAEARARGLRGYSRKTKAQLLAELSG